MAEEHLQEKFEISEAAVQLYIEHDGDFSIQQLAHALEIEAEHIYDLFPNKKSILLFFYTAIVYRYRGMIDEIDGFESYTLSEKLSNFMFTSLDIMNEHREFVKQTFDTLIGDIFQTSPFEKEVQLLFKDFFMEDASVSVSSAFIARDYFFSFLKSQYLFLVRYWIKDESADSERTIALIDKFASFIEEAMYNKVLDKGFDLAKYSLSTAEIAKDIPIIGDIIASIFKENKSE